MVPQLERVAAAFAPLDPQHHAFGVNVGDLQRDNLHGPQAGPSLPCVWGPQGPPPAGAAPPPARARAAACAARRRIRDVVSSPAGSNVNLKKNRCTVTVALMVCG